MLTIRRAHVTDAPQMAVLINEAAERGRMLPKSLSYLYENIREFHVAIVSNDDGSDRVVGVCGLSIIWANLSEVVSLVVDSSQQGQGLGARLTQTVLDEAKELGVRKVMSLTYEQRFFERLGFTVVDRKDLPLKVWADCIRCPKHDACDEIAMVYVNESVPEIEQAKAPVPAPSEYYVPVIRRS